MFFVRLLRYNTARPPPAPDIRGKDLKQNPGGVKATQSLSSPSGRSHVSHRNIRSTFACITGSQMSVVLFLRSIKGRYFEMSKRFLCKWTGINFD